MSAVTETTAKSITKFSILEFAGEINESTLGVAEKKKF